MRRRVEGRDVRGKRDMGGDVLQHGEYFMGTSNTVVDLEDEFQERWQIDGQSAQKRSGWL